MNNSAATVVYNYFDLRWRSGYSFVSDAPNRFNLILEDLIDKSDETGPRFAYRYDSDARAAIGFIKLTTRAQSLERNITYVHAVLLEDRDDLPENSDAIQHAFQEVYGPEPMAFIDALVTKAARLEKDEGRGLVEGLMIRSAQLGNLPQSKKTVLPNISLQGSFEDPTDAKEDLRSLRSLRLSSVLLPKITYFLIGASIGLLVGHYYYGRPPKLEAPAAVQLASIENKLSSIELGQKRLEKAITEEVSRTAKLHDSRNEAIKPDVEWCSLAVDSNALFKSNSARLRQDAEKAFRDLVKLLHKSGIHPRKAGVSLTDTAASSSSGMRLRRQRIIILEQWLTLNDAVPVKTGTLPLFTVKVNPQGLAESPSVMLGLCPAIPNQEPASIPRREHEP